MGGPGLFVPGCESRQGVWLCAAAAQGPEPSCCQCAAFCCPALAEMSALHMVILICFYHEESPCIGK